MDNQELLKAIGEMVSASVEKKLGEHTKPASDPAAGLRKAASAGARHAADPLKTKPLAEMTKNEREVIGGRMIRYMACAKGHASIAAQLAEDDGDENLVKALGQSTLAGGGALVPVEVMTDVTEFLRDRSSLRAAGVSSVPMSGRLSLPFVNAGGVAAYASENTNLSHSNPTFGELELNDHPMGYTTAVSNLFLRNANPGTDAMLFRDMRNAVAAKENITFIRSDGSLNTPKGLLYWAPAGNKIASTSSFTLTTVNNELSQARQKLMDGNVDITRAFWLFAPRSLTYLFSALTTTSAYAFRGELERGTLFGHPFFVSSQIPINLGGGTNESEVYFASADTLVIADNGGVEISAFDGGAYHDGSNVISGISQMQTVLRVSTIHDFGARQRGAEIAVIEAVKWA
jgi:HK97 family phage major capsid protein